MTPQPSAIDAAYEAIAHTRRHLFPVDPKRWLVLGFLAFLDQCGRGGTSFPSRPGGGSWPHGGGSPDLSRPIEWAAAHVGLIVALTALGLALAVAFMALVLWINSRGIFMYLDAVASGRTDVARPWHEHAERAGSLFAFRFAVGLGTFVVLLMLAGGGVLLGVAAYQDRLASGVALAVGLLVLLPLVLLLAVAMGLLSLALRDFVAPLQLERNLSCGDALRLFTPLVKAQPLAFLLYLILKIAFQVVVAVAFVALCCMLCCVILIPVLMQALLQPVFYFERAWSLYFLRQLGHDVLRVTGASEPS